MPPQTQSEHPETSPETDPTIPQTTPLDVPAEPEIQEPAESVDNCIAYGKEYTVSIGLNLDETVVECWDTPITSSDPYYIKRDITSRQNVTRNVRI